MVQLNFRFHMSVDAQPHRLNRWESVKVLLRIFGGEGFGHVTTLRKVRFL